MEKSNMDTGSIECLKNELDFLQRPVITNYIIFTENQTGAWIQR